MIVPDDFEDEGMEYFDDDFNSFTPETVKSMGELSEGEEDGPIRRGASAVSGEPFRGFKTTSNQVVGDEMISHNGGGDVNGNIQAAPNPVAGNSFLDDTMSIFSHNGGGDVNGNVEVPSPAREPEADVFGRKIAKGRSNWFTSEYGSNFRLMDGELIPRTFVKSVRKATSDLKYIKQLYNSDICLDELRVGEETKTIGYGTYFKGEPDAWNVWDSESKLATLTTLDVQRNVAAAVNSRRKMRWAIGVESNGMVTGVPFPGEEKDILSQAIDFALSREFVPELDPRIVHTEFVPVSRVSGTRVLILITINDQVESLHQLSSGRIFYLMGDTVVMADSMNHIRLSLEQRMRHDECVKSKGLGVKKESRMGKWMGIMAGVGIVVGSLYLAKRWRK